MEDSQFVIFIVFGCIWVLMGTAGVIALLKSDGQEIRFGKWGLYPHYHCTRFWRILLQLTLTNCTL